jgi:hypothetical protein
MGRTQTSAIPAKPPVTHVIWQDSYSLDDTWHPTTQPVERRLIRSVGFQIATTPEYIVLAATYDPTSETYGNAIAIHRPAILAETPLT